MHRILLLAILLAIVPLARGESHTFTFDASGVSPKPARVNLAGDFNGWSKDATPMKDAGGGKFEAMIRSRFSAPT